MYSEYLTVLSYRSAYYSISLIYLTETYNCICIRRWLNDVNIRETMSGGLAIAGTVVVIVPAAINYASSCGEMYSK